MQHSWLRIAAKEGFLDVVKNLVEHQADVNQLTKEGGSPLIAAAQEDEVEIVKYLIEHKADVNHYAVLFKDGTTPLLSAVSHNNAEVVSLLLKSKADVNLSNKDKTTPVFLAAQDGHIASLKILLKKNPKINIPKDGGYTGLMMAAQNGHLKAVQALVNESKDVINETNLNGETPLFKAAQQGHVEIVKWLIEQGAVYKDPRTDGISALHIAAYNGHTKVVELLLSKGEDINKKTLSEGATALFFAAQNGHVETVKYLLDRKASINQAIKIGTTPLYGAVLYNQGEVVNLLLQSDADVNQSEEHNATPVALAILVSEDVHVVKALLEAGADVYKDFKLPIENAVWSNALTNYSQIKNPELVRLLEPYYFINHIKENNYNQRAISKLKSIRLKNDNVHDSVKNYKELSEQADRIMVLIDEYKAQLPREVQDKITEYLDKIIKQSFKQFALAYNVQMERASIEKLKNDSQNLLTTDYATVSLSTAFESYGLFNRLSSTAGITKLSSGSIAKWPFNSADGKPSTELRANSVY